MKHFLFVWLALLAIASPDAWAATIFESGILGATGIPRASISDDIPASTVSPTIFIGVRFQIDQPANIQQVGGHFVKNTDANASFFGAIVRLDSAIDFPNSENLSTPDVVGSTLLSFSEPSAEVFGNIDVHLDPGWYTLVFGSGLFGASGRGSALRNNMDVDDPSYIAFGPNLHWFDLDIFGSFFDNHRFVVKGEFVPEPSSIFLWLPTMSAVFMLTIARTRASKRL